MYLFETYWSEPTLLRNTKLCHKKVRAHDANVHNVSAYPVTHQNTISNLACPSNLAAYNQQENNSCSDHANMSDQTRTSEQAIISEQTCHSIHAQTINSILTSDIAGNPVVLASESSTRNAASKDNLILNTCSYAFQQLKASLGIQAGVYTATNGNICTNTS
jgi:hypothetical protein